MTLSLFDQTETKPVKAQRRSMQLRPYQQEAVTGVIDQLKAARSTLVVLPTGCGKTICFAFAARHFAQRGRVLILAHRQELIDQAAEKVRAVTGESVCVEMADSYAKRGGNASRFVVSSIQTQMAGKNGGRMQDFYPHDFSLVIVDEAHHAPADSYKRVLAHYQHNPDLKILGVTATPDRADEEALGQVFDTVAYNYEISNAIEDGWLVPIKQHQVFVDGLDFSQVRTTAGDLNGAELKRIMEEEEMLHGVSGPTFELADGRKTLVFCAAVHQAERVAEILNRHQPGCADWLHGGTPKDDRREMIRAYGRGDFQFLVNVGVATEGFDDPGIKVVAIARPTKSRALYAQMVGRGTRPLPGLIDGGKPKEERIQAIAGSPKPHVEIIDFVGNSGNHKLMTAADILGGNYPDDTVDLAREIVREEASQGKPADVGDAIEKARQEMRRRREEEREKRRSVIAKVHYSKESIDPFDFFDIEPERERGWNRNRQISDKMRAMLERNRIDADQLTYTQAQQVIRKIIESGEKMPCTEGQARVLRRNGLDPAQFSKADASKKIDEIAQKQGWGKK